MQLLVTYRLGGFGIFKGYDCLFSPKFALGMAGNMSFADSECIVEFGRLASDLALIFIFLVFADYPLNHNTLF